MAQAPTTRPAGVPPQARFSAERGVWEHGALDKRGRRHGAYAAWRPDGNLLIEQRFQHGVPHGAFRRFHPDGSVSREGSFVEGQLDGTVVAYASETGGAEPLRGCCVPKGAAVMRARYTRGRCHGERFYDASDRLLLSDGSLHPARPPNVPDEAWFDESSRHWQHGSYGAVAEGRTGRWLRWTETGALLESAHFDEGKRHGLTEIYEPSDGRLIERCHYVAGVRDGSYQRFGIADLFAIEGAHEVRGTFLADLPAGQWQLLDAEATSVWSGDLGELPEDGSPVLQLDVESRWPLADLWRALIAERRYAEAACVLARLAARGEAPEDLGAFFRAHALPVSDAERARRTQRATADRHSNPSTFQALLLSGADPAALFVALAAPLPHAVAHDLVEAARRLDPSSTDALVSRATHRLGLGRVVDARADIAELAALHPAAAALLEQYLAALLPRFDFWPAKERLEPGPFDALPDAPVQPLAVFRSAIQKCATRLRLVRAALLDQLDEATAAALPPDPAHLLPDGAVALEEFDFDIEEDGKRVPIHVREALDVTGLDASQLLRLIRAEWTTLGWLCWTAGLDEIRLPTELRPPTEFTRALGTSALRAWRCSDRARTRGLRARTQKVPGFDWEGCDIDALPSALVPLAIDHYVEMRAVLSWSTDELCRSLWQDDLRPL